MIKKFEEIYEAAQNLGQKKTISVAMADDVSVLEAVKVADEKGVAKFLLVGNQVKVKMIASQVGYDVKDEDIIPAYTDEEIASKSVELIRDGKAEILMKGHISTPILMKAVLNKETGLRMGNVLSHVAVAEVSTYHKLILLSDGGINILPDLETKIAILNNMVFVANRLGIVKPNIAALCPIENVNPKIQETVDAAKLQEMSKNGKFGDAVLEGPIAMDVALSAKAAERKGITSKIAGQTDGFLVPNITTGNAVIKVLMLLANAEVGGLVIGAKVPIILLSRSDKPEEKLNSIALSILVSD